MIRGEIDGRIGGEDQAVYRVDIGGKGAVIPLPDQSGDGIGQGGKLTVLQAGLPGEVGTLRRQLPPAGGFPRHQDDETAADPYGNAQDQTEHAHKMFLHNDLIDPFRRIRKEDG